MLVSDFHLVLVVVNAVLINVQIRGLFNSYGSAFDTTPDEMREHFDVCALCSGHVLAAHFNCF